MWIWTLRHSGLAGRSILSTYTTEMGIWLGALMRFQAVYWVFVLLLVWPATAQIPSPTRPVPPPPTESDNGPHTVNALPDTAAGKAATDWLAAFNSGDRDKVEAMRMKYHLKNPTDNLLQAFRQRGGW